MSRRVGAGSGAPTPLDPKTDVKTRVGEVLLVAGEGRLSTHELRGPLVIGRDAGCDVVIANTSLSRRHVVVLPGPPVTVQDLDSTNGTRIGDRVIHGGDPVVLAVGDSFHVGPFSFLLVTRSVGSNPSVTGKELLSVVDPTVNGVGSLIEDLAIGGINVLILGETGVGKEVLAETIHTLSRRQGALVRINCAAISEPLLESELFGHEKGSFTGAAAMRVGLLEAAHGGTLFLDEIGELPAGIQAKLLRAVEQREVVRVGATRPIPIDVRFVAATNRDLPTEVSAGRFRGDLFFRLDGVTLTIPPLRDRGGLIGRLALHFLADACNRAGRAPVPLRAEVLAALEAYRWPGNVRELKAVIERALLLARGKSPAVRHLVFSPHEPGSAEREEEPAFEPNANIVFGDDERADRERIMHVLNQCAGNQSRAAKMLGISRSTLINKVRILRIPRPRG